MLQAEQLPLAVPACDSAGPLCVMMCAPELQVVARTLAQATTRMHATHVSTALPTTAALATDSVGSITAVSTASELGDAAESEAEAAGKWRRFGSAAPMLSARADSGIAGSQPGVQCRISTACTCPDRLIVTCLLRSTLVLSLRRNNVRVSIVLGLAVSCRRDLQDLRRQDSCVLAARARAAMQPVALLLVIARSRAHRHGLRHCILGRSAGCRCARDRMVPRMDTCKHRQRAASHCCRPLLRTAHLHNVSDQARRVLDAAEPGSE